MLQLGSCNRIQRLFLEVCDQSIFQSFLVNVASPESYAWHDGFQYLLQVSSHILPWLNVSPIWSIFSHSLFQMRFLPNSEWENFSQMDQMGETVSGRISPKWTKWGKHSQIEHACGIFFSPYRKSNHIGFFFSRGIFHGTANRSENPTKIPWGFFLF
jgi:hypothetical protein